MFSLSNVLAVVHLGDQPGRTRLVRIRASMLHHLHSAEAVVLTEIRSQTVAPVVPSAACELALRW